MADFAVTVQRGGAEQPSNPRALIGLVLAAILLAAGGWWLRQSGEHQPPKTVSSAQQAKKSPTKLLKVGKGGYVVVVDRRTPIKDKRIRRHGHSLKLGTGRISLEFFSLPRYPWVDYAAVAAESPGEWHEGGPVSIPSAGIQIDELEVERWGLERVGGMVSLTVQGPTRILQIASSQLLTNKAHQEVVNSLKWIPGYPGIEKAYQDAYGRSLRPKRAKEKANTESLEDYRERLTRVKGKGPPALAYARPLIESGHLTVLQAIILKDVFHDHFLPRKAKPKKKGPRKKLDPAVSAADGFPGIGVRAPEDRGKKAPEKEGEAKPPR